MPDETPQTRLSLGPVSYTHLDVYKRQAPDDGPPEVNIFTTARVPGEVHTAPVSYTHLDVYKRQVQPPARREKLRIVESCAIDASKMRHNIYGGD